MRIVLDVSSALMGTTGVARYSRALLDALRVRDDVDLRPIAIGFGRAEPPIGTRVLRVPRRLVDPLWLRGIGKADAWLGPGDVLHATGHVPAASRLPTVLTVHDLLGLTHAELHPRSIVRQHSGLLDLLRRDVHAVVPSRATRDDLVSLGVDASTITVAPLAATLAAAPRPGYAPDLPYVLHVGALVVRKDPVTAVRALVRMDERVHLFFAGPYGDARERLESEARELHLEDRVHVLGRVMDDELAALLDGALALVTTSLGEGFGLPVLEAMTRGVPVVASDLPVHREVAGDAGRFAVPGDPDSFAEGLTAIIGDDETRRMHVSRGRLRSRDFTWDGTAAATLAAYAKAQGHSS